MTADRPAEDRAADRDPIDPAPDDGAEEIAGTGAAPVVPDPDLTADGSDDTEPAGGR